MNLASNTPVPKVRSVEITFKTKLPELLRASLDRRPLPVKVSLIVEFICLLKRQFLLYARKELVSGIILNLKVFR